MTEPINNHDQHNFTTDFAPVHLSLPLLTLKRLAEEWLREDIPSFDAGAIAVGNKQLSATLYAKSSLVLAGCNFFDTIFSLLSCKVTWEKKEGEEIIVDQHRIKIATVTGAANSVLQGERTALNVLAECCSIAGAARIASTKAKSFGWKGRIAGTRKTAPGLRLVQKYGMAIGGMDTHRMDLSSMVMLKDNHIAAAGDVYKAIKDVKRVSGFSMKIEVECENWQEAQHACKAGADVVMLDNFQPQEFNQVAKMVKQEWPHVIVEASGGLNMDNMTNYMIPEANVISFSVNKYTKPVDLSLKIDPSV